MLYERCDLRLLIKEYLFSICVAAIISSVIKHLIGKNTANSKIIKMISGVFMAMAVLAPMVDFRLTDYKKYYNNFQLDAQSFTEIGESIGKEERNQIILEQTQAYIISEASRLGVAVDVRVSLSKGDPPVPESVDLSGNVSPYMKSRINELITQRLDVSEEKIQWT